MTNRPFIVGFCWIMLTTSILGVFYQNLTLGLTVLGINAALQGMYLLLFRKAYREKRREIVQPSLLLITLQLLSFFVTVGVFWYWKLSFLTLFWAMLVFFGVLAWQVREQILFLKTL